MVIQLLMPAYVLIISVMKNHGLLIERARVRIPFATVSNVGQFCSLHGAPDHIKKYRYLFTASAGKVEDRICDRACVVHDVVYLFLVVSGRTSSCPAPCSIRVEHVLRGLVARVS